MSSRARRWLELLHRIETGILAALLGVLVVLSAAQIALRNLLDTSVTWGDPLLRVLVLWVGLLGALAASREDRQISVDVLSRLLSGRARSAAEAVTAVFTTLITGLLAYHAARFVLSELQAGSPGFGAAPAWALEAILPVGFGLIALRYAILSAVRVRALVGHGAGREAEP